VAPAPAVANSAQLAHAADAGSGAVEGKRCVKPPAGDDSTVAPAAVPPRPGIETEPPTSPVHAGQPLVEKPAIEHYELGETLGRGGMGEVIAAVDLLLGRDVALKRMHAAEPSGDAVRRFVREAKVQALLDHPAIVPVHELGTDAAGRPYFTMKRLSGTTLHERLAAGGAPGPLLRAFVDVCFAIQLAHERQIVHRDLKPSNVMLGDYGDVYVIDWGVARVIGTRRTSQVAIPVDSLTPDATSAGVMLGTLGYMAPEQMRGLDVGPAADVYSLGAILFEILAGQPLHAPGKAAISSTLANPTDSPARRAPERAIAPELDAICVAALAEEPNQRPTARALAERIQRYLDGDRDLEQRRRLAAEQLALARAALADPARSSEAGQAATRALALDPESADAAQLVAKLALDPPRELPAELVASLEAEEREINRQRGYTAMKLFLATFLFLPIFVFVQDVRSVPQLVALYAAATLMAVLAWHNGKTGRTPTWMLLAGNFAFSLAFARLTSTFVLLVACVCGQAVALASRADIARRKWMLIGWVTVSLIAPFVLEYAGVLEPTWTMTSQGLIVHGSVIHTVYSRDILFLVLGQTALAIAVTALALTTTRSREQAQRRAHIQAWHLARLIPRGQAPPQSEPRR
jgi:serine/threonine-protein kinase